MSPASSRYQRSRSSQTLQDHPEDDPPQGAQPDPETLSDSSLACEILSQQPRNKTWSASHTRTHMYWTQKGRLFIYDLLKAQGILPVIEREEGDQA